MKLSATVGDLFHKLPEVDIFDCIVLGAGSGGEIKKIRQKFEKNNIVAIEAGNFWRERLNSISNITYLQRIITSSKQDFLTYYESSHGPQAGSLVKSVNSISEHKVKTIRLNEIIDEYFTDKIDLLSMDIEGEEINILRDNIDKVSKKVKSIHIHTHSRKIEADLIQLLQKNDYELIFLFPFPKKPIFYKDGIQFWYNKNYWHKGITERTSWDPESEQYN